MLSVENIKKYYSTLDNQTLLEVSQNPKGIRKDVVKVLLDELQKRNIGKDLVSFIQDETNSFEGIERENLASEIKNSLCTKCKFNKDLKGYAFTSLISIIIICFENTNTYIICRQCANKERIKSIAATLFLGWWSPRGLLWTPINLFSELYRIFFEETESKTIINNFIFNNTSKFRQIKKGNGTIENLLLENNTYIESE